MPSLGGSGELSVAAEGPFSQPLLGGWLGQFLSVLWSPDIVNMHVHVDQSS